MWNIRIFKRERLNVYLGFRSGLVKSILQNPKCPLNCFESGTVSCFSSMVLYVGIGEKYFSIEPVSLTRPSSVDFTIRYDDHHSEFTVERDVDPVIQLKKFVIEFYTSISDIAKADITVPPRYDETDKCDLLFNMMSAKQTKIFVESIFYEKSICSSATNYAIINSIKVGGTVTMRLHDSENLYLFWEDISNQHDGVNIYYADDNTGGLSLLAYVLPGIVTIGVNTSDGYNVNDESATISCAKPIPPGNKKTDMAENQGSTKASSIEPLATDINFGEASHADAQCSMHDQYDVRVDVVELAVFEDGRWSTKIVPAIRFSSRRTDSMIPYGMLYIRNDMLIVRTDAADYRIILPDNSDDSYVSTYETIVTSFAKFLDDTNTGVTFSDKLPFKVLAASHDAVKAASSKSHD